MKKIILPLLTAAFLSGCVNTATQSKSPASPAVVSAYAKATKSSKQCRINGSKFNWKSSHPALKTGLCRLSQKYGPLTITSSCRTKKSNRGVRNSYHLYSRGCKAADLYVAGVPNSKLLAWWKTNVGGGRGTYSCRRFIHLDVGPNRAWHWNTCRKRRR
jgi:uncharacterized protein YceK